MGVCKLRQACRGLLLPLSLAALTAVRPAIVQTGIH